MGRSTGPGWPTERPRVRKSKPIGRRLAATAGLAAFLLGGCCAIEDAGRGPRAYGGIRSLVEGECGPGAFGPIGLVFMHPVPAFSVLALDVPLSLTLDTILLPFAVVREALGSRPREDGSCGRASGEGEPARND